MEILQPYNENTLQLVSDDATYEFYPGFLQRGVIKLSVFSDINSFLDAEDLQQDVDFYLPSVDELNLFLKPNEYLDRNGFPESNYNLQYDFLIRLEVKENDNDEEPIEFHISEISPSRKEIRLSITGKSEAMVPGLGLNINENEFINFISSMSFIVSLKSFSSSPGYAIIKSLETSILELIFFNL